MKQATINFERSNQFLQRSNSNKLFNKTENFFRRLGFEWINRMVGGEKYGRYFDMFWHNLRQCENRNREFKSFVVQRINIEITSSIPIDTSLLSSISIALFPHPNYRLTTGKNKPFFSSWCNNFKWKQSLVQFLSHP